MDDGRREYKTGAMIPGTVYRVGKLIGAGGMGTVYDVEDTTVGKRYVLKTLHPELGGRWDLAKRMEAEARALGRLAHTNIVEVVTAGVTTDELRLPYYVMEKLHGENLRSVLTKKGSLELPFALHIGIDLLDALDCAHDQNILHRDVKPDNIFLHRGNNNVTVTKLLDFGISRDNASPSVTMTGGRFMGTLRYAGPEQLQGKPVTTRTDLYSAALVIYEMIAGRGPFDDVGDGKNWSRPQIEQAIAQAHVGKEPPWLSDLGIQVPTPLEKLLRSALAKDPDKRPKDAFTFAAQVRNIKRQEDRPRGAPDSATTAVALIRGLDVSKPPSPLPAPMISEVGQAPPTPQTIPDSPPRSPETHGLDSPAPASPTAYAPTIPALTRASTPHALSPETTPGMIPPSVAPLSPTLLSPGVAHPIGGQQQAPRLQGGVDRSADTRSAVMAPMPRLGPAGTEPIGFDTAQPPWSAPATSAPAPGGGVDPSEIAATQQLLVALPGREPPVAPTDGAQVRNVVPGGPMDRRRAMAMAIVAGASFAVLATGTVAVGWRLHMRAQAGEAATAAVPGASSFPMPAVPQPTLATPLFDEIPSASAASAPPGPLASATVAGVPSAEPAASSTAPAASSAADAPKPADVKQRPVKPARTQPAASGTPPKRHLPGSGL
jgi:serine/threonine protein kinase